MSEAPIPTLSVRERLSGKWQIPALGLSLLLLVAAALQIKSPDRKLGLEGQIKLVQQASEAGLHDTSATLARNLLTWDDIDDATRAMLQLYLARAAFGTAERLADTKPATMFGVLDAYETAITAEAPLTADDYRHMAACYENIGEHLLAVRCYEEGARLAPAPALADRRRVIELSEYPLRVDREKLDALLEAYIADAQDSPQQLIWALSRRVEILSASGGWQQASELLASYRNRFVGTPYEKEFGYLTAVCLNGANQYGEAERVLRDLLNSVTVSDSVYAKAGWLLGRVVMNDGGPQRPEEAIAILRDVVASRADRAYVAAARLGIAEAQAELMRYGDSLTSYREVVRDLARLDGSRLINPDVIRSSLAAVSEQCQREGRLETALEFMRVAVSLVEPRDTDQLSRYLVRLADLQAASARAMVAAPSAPANDDIYMTLERDVLPEARALFDEAGENYVRVSWMSTLNERRSAAAMWNAAGLFDEGGNHERAIAVLQAFARERGDAEIIPRVLLRLGRSLQTEERFAEAVDVYRRNISSFPRSPHANASLIPLAECYMALGVGHENQAETTLKMIIENSEIFTPEAPEFRDAMYLLGDLYVRQGRYEDAIPVLDETLRNYPGDPRVPRGMFLAADAYMQSALVIKDELLKPEFVGESQRLRAELTARFEEGARRFRTLTERLEKSDETKLDDLHQTYLRDSRLYEAACLFELGRYKDALALYERAAWIYKDTPASLGAYVQVINCYIFLGRKADAESALRRAQYLVQSIADEHFSAPGQFETREGWQRYFEWVAEVLIAE